MENFFMCHKSIKNIAADLFTCDLVTGIGSFAGNFSSTDVDFGLADEDFGSTDKASGLIDEGMANIPQNP
jgi:hypothetical protein